MDSYDNYQKLVRAFEVFRAHNLTLYEQIEKACAESLHSSAIPDLLASGTQIARHINELSHSVVLSVQPAIMAMQSSNTLILRAFEAMTQATPPNREVLSHCGLLASQALIAAQESAFIIDVSRAYEFASHSFLIRNQLSMEMVGSLLSISDNAKKTLLDSADVLVQTQEALCRNFSELDLTFGMQETRGFLIPAQEVFLNESMLAVISTEELVYVDEQEELYQGEIASGVSEELHALLRLQGEKFIRMWMGATQTIESDNPDRTRHFSVSSREILDQLLCVLAPENEVRKWDSSPKLYDKDGNPKREARLKYIYRHVNNKKLEEFILADINSFVRLIRLFNKGVHTKVIYSDRQLKFLRFRAESLLYSILTTCSMNS